MIAKRRQPGRVVREQVTDWGGVQLIFADGSKVALTAAHWDAMREYAVQTRVADGD